MRSGDVVRVDFGVPARGEPGFIRPAVVITADAVLEFKQHAVVVTPCTSTVRRWESELPIADFGHAQAHLPTSVSVDRVIEHTGYNIGSIALAQLRELVATIIDA